MEGRARTVLAVAVVLLVLAVPLVALFASGGGGDDAPAAAGGLRVERSVYAPELLVYVEQRANTPERSGGRRTVTLRCEDADGRAVASQPESWPFTDTDQGTLDPHTHVPMDGAGLDAVARCRLEGTRPLLDGPVL